MTSSETVLYLLSRCSYDLIPFFPFPKTPEWADAPLPHAEVFGKGKGLVLGEAKSEVGVPVIRLEAEPAGGTHEPRSVVPRTPVKGVITGLTQTLFLTAVIATIVLRTRPLFNVTAHVSPNEFGAKLATSVVAPRYAPTTE